MHILTTARLSLREFTPADAAFILELLSDPDWHRNINNPNVQDQAGALAWMEGRLFEPYRRHGHGFWAVERLDSGELIGMCGLFKRDALPLPDVGYAFLPRGRGQGFAREAAAACLSHGHEKLGMTAILAITAVDNPPSVRVLESIGMVEQGVELLAGYEEPSRVFRWEP
ncbi:MAG: GNAT family N-acetyltransferase [Paucibacter sp.]|nr:GNAT family N-acetyltransferase [Roseateles sp.]